MIGPYLAVLGVVAILIAVLQKDLGQITVMAATFLVLLILAGRSLKMFALLIASGLVVFVILIITVPHRMARLRSWWSMVQDTFLSLFPDKMAGGLRVDAVREPYQIANALNAFKNSDFWGQGLGAGQFKLGYLSEVHTDFVLAGMTEELGFLALVVVMLAMLFLLFRLFKISASVENPVYYLFSAGIGLLILFALIVNCYGISGMTPIKGIAVPFLSYGGSQTLANALAIGMVLMISKRRMQ